MHLIECLLLVTANSCNRPLWDMRRQDLAAPKLRVELTHGPLKMEGQLQSLRLNDDEPAKGMNRSTACNAPSLDLSAQLFQMCVVGLGRADGVDMTRALMAVCEIGACLSRIIPESIDTCVPQTSGQAGGEMSTKRFTEEFKVEAFGQVVDGG